MASNFDFLEEKFPVLSNLGRSAEQYCYYDSNSCLIKLGMMGEIIVKLMYSYDDIALPKKNNAAARINKLMHEGLLTENQAYILHELRINRNKAVHENYSSVADDVRLLLLSIELCDFFMWRYGHVYYEHHDLITPPKEMVFSINAMLERQKEKQLEDEAVEEAKGTPPMSRSKRRRLAEKAKAAARKRIEDEAETNFLIDEQLRQAGWEADCDKIRYAAGARPQWDKKLAIAEYPVDFHISENGYVTYALFENDYMVAALELKSHPDGTGVYYYVNILDEEYEWFAEYWDEMPLFG